VNHPNAKHDTRKEAIDMEAAPMEKEQPAWARRMTNEREVRHWSQAEAVRAMRAHAPGQLAAAVETLGIRPDDAERVLPADHRQDLRDRHPRRLPGAPRPDANAEMVAASGMDTLEPVARSQRSDLDDATLNAVRVMADTLCSEYASDHPMTC
jgi:hypothetical protein